MKISRSLASTLSLALIAAGCGSGSLGGPSEMTSTPVGTTGGTASSSDGSLKVVIPAGALPSNLTVTVEPAASPGGELGTTYEIGPTGTQFAMPVTLTLDYAGIALNGTAESSLRVATHTASGWQILPGAVVDTNAKTVSGLTTHLSPYAIVAAAEGDICTSVSGGQSCSANATTDGTGTASSCTVSTCATAGNPCGQWSNATMTSCTDSPTGFTATCCAPHGQPICTTVGAPRSCSASTDGTMSCLPAPVCAGSNPCAGLLNATMQSCTDTANGYQAVCCYPEGEVPPSSSGGQGGFSDGSAGSSGGAGNGGTLTGMGGSTVTGSGGSTGTARGGSTGAGGSIDMGSGGGFGAGGSTGAGGGTIIGSGGSTGTGQGGSTGAGGGDVTSGAGGSAGMSGGAGGSFGSGGNTGTTGAGGDATSGAGGSAGMSGGAGGSTGSGGDPTQGSGGTPL
jgi:hypothetical protein